MSRARPETNDGRRKLTDEHRAKLSASSRRQWDAMTPEQRVAALNRIGRTPKSTSSSTTSKPPSPDPSTDPPVERRNPLAMTPLEAFRALRGRR